MNFKVLLVLGLVAVVAVQGDYELDEKDKECIKTSKVDQTKLEAYEKGGGVVPEDDQKAVDFLVCRYGHSVDKNNKLIINDETIDELAQYVAVILKSNMKLAIIVAKQIMHDCQEVEANSKGQAVVKISNCIARELEDYACTIK